MLYDIKSSFLRKEEEEDDKMLCYMISTCLYYHAETNLSLGDYNAGSKHKVIQWWLSYYQGSELMLNFIFFVGFVSVLHAECIGGLEIVVAGLLLYFSFLGL
jgi:hypothetical protein